MENYKGNKKVEKYLVYDFETTNLPIGTGHDKEHVGNGMLTGVRDDLVGIHQLSGCVIVVENGVPEIKERFDYHIRPHDGAEISDESLEVAGVTREQIMAYPSESEAHARFIEMCLRYVDVFDKADKFTLVGYNNKSFDDRLLMWFLARNKYKGKTYWKGNLFFKGTSVDILPIYSALVGSYRQFMDNFKLGTLCELFLPKDGSEENYHSADFDVEQTARLFIEFYPLVREFREAHKQLIMDYIRGPKTEIQ